MARGQDEREEVPEKTWKPKRKVWLHSLSSGRKNTDQDRMGLGAKRGDEMGSVESNRLLNFAATRDDPRDCKTEGLGEERKEDGGIREKKKKRNTAAGRE